MNSATLITLRESCGLTRADLAGLIKSPKKPGEFIKERTVKYWENGRTSIPDDVAMFIEDLDATINLLVEDFFRVRDCNTVDYLILFKNDSDFWMAYPELVGLPVSCHSALINRIRLRLDRPIVIKWQREGAEND